MPFPSFFTGVLLIEHSALRRAFPGAIFYTHDGTGQVARYDVTKLVLGSNPGEQSKAVLQPSNQPRKYVATPLLGVGVDAKESWGEKLFELETGGLLVLELGMLLGEQGKKRSGTNPRIQ